MSLDIRGPLRERPQRRPHGHPRAAVGRAALVLVLVTVAALALLMTHRAGRDGVLRGDAPSADRAAIRPAEIFLREWVDPDGRVVRRDQGGDTVSEGQAYGLLLALAVDDRPTFTRIWTWTRTHLQRADGGLAWLWRDGAVRDPEPAADADVDAATALLRAGRAWHDDSLTRAGTAIASTVLRTSTVPAPPGRVLTGGPWARDMTPAPVAPDYVVPGTADDLARATGQDGWRQVAAGTGAMQNALIGTDRLPPDWVTAAGSAPATRVVPSGAPGSGQPAQYGLSAPRLFVRLAASCRPADRALAARGNDAARTPDAPAIRSLDGGGLVDWRNPLIAVGAAAVQTARGDRPAAARALAVAAEQQRQSSTYYGAAWLALGTVLLRTDRLGCAVPGPA